MAQKLAILLDPLAPVQLREMFGLYLQTHGNIQYVIGRNLSRLESFVEFELVGFDDMPDTTVNVRSDCLLATMVLSTGQAGIGFHAQAKLQTEQKMTRDKSK